MTNIKKLFLYFIIPLKIIIQTSYNYFAFLSSFYCLRITRSKMFFCLFLY